MPGAQPEEKCRPPNAVLVVDDDQDILEILALLLESTGYRVLTADDGRAALAVLGRDDAVGLILLDMMMPVMDGREFRAEQLADPNIAEIPVVVLTGDGHAAEKAAAVQAVDYVVKPAHVEEVLATVARHYAC